jgi:hypothetical protein
VRLEERPRKRGGGRLIGSELRRGGRVRMGASLDGCICAQILRSIPKYILME